MGRAVAGSVPEGKLFLLRDDEDLVLSTQQIVKLECLSYAFSYFSQGKKKKFKIVHYMQGVYPSNPEVTQHVGNRSVSSL